MSESRRSATQRTPVARLTAAPRRLTEPGGRGGDDDVDLVPAHELDRGRDGRRGATASSDPARAAAGRSARPAAAGARARAPRQLVLGRWTRGARFRVSWTIAAGGGTSDSSRCIRFESAGTSTCVSIPSSGRYVAIFSGRGRRRRPRAASTSWPGEPSRATIVTKAASGPRRPLQSGACWTEAGGCGRRSPGSAPRRSRWP